MNLREGVGAHRRQPSRSPSQPRNAPLWWSLQQGAAAARGVVVADGGDACEHRRVRVGEEDVQWVRREVSEVLTRELLERTHECLGLAVGLHRVTVGLELVGTGARGQHHLVVSRSVSQ